MNNIITVGISDMKIGGRQDILATYALGSCVGICLYDPVKMTGSLGHILLPTLGSSADQSNKFKFADTCIKQMVSDLERFGCLKRNLYAKIAGGASMFEIIGDNSISNIGQRNVQSVKETLKMLQIKIVAEDTGLNYGRTLFFYLNDGSVHIKSFAKNLKIL